ncbi:hypothetical protein [Paraburkholderia caledonica]
MSPNNSPIEYLIAFGIALITGAALTVAIDWYVDKARSNAARRVDQAHA